MKLTNGRAQEKNSNLCPTEFTFGARGGRALYSRIFRQIKPNEIRSVRSKPRSRPGIFSRIVIITTMGKKKEYLRVCCSLKTFVGLYATADRPSSVRRQSYVCVREYVRATDRFRLLCSLSESFDLNNTRCAISCSACSGKRRRALPQSRFHVDAFTDHPVIPAKRENIEFVEGTFL